MSDSQKWLVLTFFILCVGLIYLLSPILMPFVMAAMFAYLGDPLADRLEIFKIYKWPLGRTNAVVVVFFIMSLIISLLLVVVIPKLENQINHLLSHLPDYAKWLNSIVIPWLEQHTGIEIEKIQGDKLIAILKQNWQKAGNSAIAFVGSVKQSSAVLAEIAMNLVLIPVISFYLLRDWDVLVKSIYDLLPRRFAPTAAKLALETDVVLGAFLRGQFYVMLALGTVYSLGLWMTGLKLALLIGMMAGLVSFVPYLGSIVGIAVACIAAIIQFQDIFSLIPVALVFVVGQMLEGMVLTPLLVGDKIGLHPVAVMFAVLAGGQLFGFLGILLALPFASIVMVILRHIHDIYRMSLFYREEQGQ